MRTKILGVFVLSSLFTLIFSLVTLGCSKPIIASVTPDNGLDNQVIEVTIEGAKFHKSGQIKLSMSGETDIAASSVTLVSSKKIICKFNLNGAALGQWDLVITNVGPFTKKKRVGTLTEAFTIDTSAVDEEEPEDAVEEIDEDEVEEETVEEDSTETEVDESEIEEPETDIAEDEDPNSLLESIFFDFNESDIRDDQTGIMDKDLDILNEFAETGYIILGGHADERGPNDYNLKLSAKRAETIKQYLITNGIDASRIVIYAYGEESPSKEGSDEEAWSFNRRVDIAVWDQIPSKNEALKE